MSWSGLDKAQTSIQLRICGLTQIAVHQWNPSNMMELEQFCLEEWAKIPVARCAKLIETYPKRLADVIATLLASPFIVDFCCCRPLTICRTLFTQEREVTIEDPLGSLNNLMMLTRQRKVYPDQNTSRDPQGRKLIAALTVGRVLFLQDI